MPLLTRHTHAGCFESRTCRRAAWLGECVDKAVLRRHFRPMSVTVNQAVPAAATVTTRHTMIQKDVPDAILARLTLRAGDVPVARVVGGPCSMQPPHVVDAVLLKRTTSSSTKKNTPCRDPFFNSYHAVCHG